MRSAASKTRLRKLSMINGHHLHNVRPPQLAASLFLSRRRDVAYASIHNWDKIEEFESIENIPEDLRKSLLLDGCLLSVSYTHLRAHETRHDLVCRLLLE